MSSLNINDKISFLTDFYEFTMANCVLNNPNCNNLVYFEMFFRDVPDNGGFVIMSGIDLLIDVLNNFKFSREEINYLKELNLFNDNFIVYLENFKFECDIWAVPEGTPVFPQEPILIIKGPYIQAQLIETLVLLIINHQSLIATKANRVVRAAKGREVFEFGARRAQGMDSALYGARAAFIGGCSGTSLVLAAKKFNIPAIGTMAHSFVQLFDTELEAFSAYSKMYPKNCMLLIDTYNTLKSGIKNAIKIFNEEIIPRGYRPIGVRIDSGDIAYLSKKVRKILDDSGFKDSKICISNSLDEYIIQDVLNQGAEIDCFGVGEKLITSATSPVLNGVYKLCAVEKNNKIIPKMKISDNVSKITTPCYKSVYRLIDNKSNKFIADVMTVHDEIIDNTYDYKIFDPDNTWKQKIVSDFTAKKLHVKLFNKGICCYNSPPVTAIQKFCKQQLNMLWEEILRFENPHKYYVDLSPKLWNIKNNLIKSLANKNHEI